VDDRQHRCRVLAALAASLGDTLLRARGEAFGARSSTGSAIEGLAGELAFGGGHITLDVRRRELRNAFDDTVLAATLVVPGRNESALERRAPPVAVDEIRCGGDRGLQHAGDRRAVDTRAVVDVRLVDERLHRRVHAIVRGERTLLERRVARLHAT